MGLDPDLDLKAKIKEVVERNYTPQTIKRDRSIRQGIPGSQPEALPAAEEVDPKDVPRGSSRFRDGHKGQKARAEAKRRRLNQLARQSRRMNRRRAA